MRLSRREMLLALGSAAVARGALAQDTSIEALLSDVAKARASLQSLAGSFTQERTIGLLSTKIRSTGTLTLVRPDRLRWELAPPDEVVYWVGPEGLAYRSAQGQGRVPSATGRLAAALDDLRVLLGGDLTKLRARYDLRLISRDEEGPVFDATPRAGSGTKVDRLSFALDADLVRPRRATMVEGPRDKTDIVFGLLARDVKIDPPSVGVRQVAISSAERAFERGENRGVRRRRRYCALVCTGNRRSPTAPVN